MNVDKENGRCSVVMGKKAVGGGSLGGRLGKKIRETGNAFGRNRQCKKRGEGAGRRQKERKGHRSLASMKTDGPSEEGMARGDEVIQKKTSAAVNGLI